MKPSALAATATFSAVAVSAALICAPAPPPAPKTAFVMLPRAVASVRFVVQSPRGGVYLTIRSTDDLGRWNASYGGVYKLDFSAFQRAGTYQIKIVSPAAAVSPAFAIASPPALYHRLVLNGVRYFTSERDGADVAGSVLNRRPANLTDRRALVYADPRYDRNDNLLGRFRRIGGPVNVAGGWFDAGGGYEK